MLALVVSGDNEIVCKAFSNEITKNLIDSKRVYVDNNELAYLGPVPCGLYKIKDRYRMVTYFKTRDINLLEEIGEQLEDFREQAKIKGIQFQTDMDPMNSY